MAIAESGERKSSVDKHFTSAIIAWEAGQAELAKPEVMRGCGYSLHVNTDDALVVDQIGWVDDELSDLITKHKFELIHILK